MNAWLRLGCRLTALMALFAGVSSWLLAQPAGTQPAATEPVLPPIERVIIKPDRAAKEMEKVDKGTLILWPLAQFEDKLERARQSVKAREEKPVLTRANYRAELVDRSLSKGRGQWMVQHVGRQTAVLPIEPFNLALHQITWEQGGDGVLAEFDGKSLGLLVKPAGTQTCFFDWSARGTPNSEGMVFNLAVPRCPLSTFELKLPSNRWVFVPKNVAVVTGPHETESSEHHLWKIQTTGTTQLELTVRKVADAKSPAPAIYVRSHSIQSISPDRIAVEHDLQLDVVHGSIRDLQLESDSSLQPYEVTLKSGEIKSWKWQENVPRKDSKGKPAGTMGVLTVVFHQPVQGKLQGLRVKSIQPWPTANLWSSPALRVQGAMSRGETIQILLHPALTIGKWDAGTFHHTAIKTESDQSHAISVADLAISTLTSRRPTLMLDTNSIDLYTTERIDWEIAQQNATLRADINYTVTRGSLFELALKTPKTQPAYQIESVDLQPAEYLKNWRPTPDGLAVELKQPLTAGKQIGLRVQMRAAFGRGSPATRTILYPEVEPKGVAKRSGAVQVHLDPLLQPQLLSSSIPPSSLERAADKQTRADYVFRFRDQRLTAALRVTTLPSQMEMRGKLHVTLGEERAQLQYRWEIAPQEGKIEHIDFHLGPGFPRGWTARADEEGPRLSHWERLPVQEALPHLLTLGARNAVEAAVLESICPTASIWRFHFTEPLQKRTTITVDASMPRGLLDEQIQKVCLSLPSANPWEFIAASLASDALVKPEPKRRWSIPLMTPGFGVKANQDVVVESPFEPMEKVEARGFQNALMAKPMTEAAAWHYQQLRASDLQTGGDVSVVTRGEKRPRSALHRLDEASLTTYVARDGPPMHRIAFRLWNWREPTCELRLPAGYEVIGATMQGQSLDRLDIKADGEAVRLLLPFDHNREHVRLEVLARGPDKSTALPGLINIGIPAIEWPIAPVTFRSRIVAAPSLVPLDQEGLAAIGIPRRLAQRSTAASRLRQAWRAGQSWLWGEAVVVQVKLDQQRQSVLSAEAQMHTDGAKGMRLSEAIDQLATHHLKSQAPLIIDAVALRELRLRSNTMVAATAFAPQGRPFWESLGLVYLPCPSGAILTSAARVKQLRISDAADAVELDPSIREAILHGRDASGAFLLAMAWSGAADDNLPADVLLPYKGVAGESAGANEWEVLATGALSDHVILVDMHVARVIGWILAAIVALVLWKILRSVEVLSCLRLYLLLLTATLLVLIWLPLQLGDFLVVPTLVVQLAASLICMIQLVNRPESSKVSEHSTVAGPIAPAMLAFVMVGGAAWSAVAQAQPANGNRVLIIDSPKPSVLVTPELVAKLDEVDKFTPLGKESVVIVSAKYTGKVADSNARFDAVYEIHSLKDRASLFLGLSGVQLHEEVFLDGAPIFPSPQKAGYAIPIRGKGPHRLRLSFTARVVPSGDHVDLKFTIPKLPQNELSVQWATPVQAVHNLHGWGEEILTVVPGQSVKHLHAQLGYEGAVHVRWAASATGPAAKSIDVREAHFWDLRPGSVALISSFNYSIGKGTLTQLNIALPDRLQVRHVDVTASPQAPAVATPIVIKSWQVLGKGAARRLVVEFAQPVTGNVHLHLEAIPQLSIRDRVLLLALPAPLQGKSVAGLLGYQLDTQELRSNAQNLAVQGISAADFESLWKKQTGRVALTPSRAYNFQRKSTQAGLELAIQPEARQVRFHLDWNIDLHHAEVRGQFTVTSPFEDIGFLQFTVDPTLTVADVAGADVRHWSIQDRVLQVWLRNSRKQVTLELTGWRAVSAKDMQAKRPQNLPLIYPLDMQITAGSLMLRPALDVQLDVEQVRRLRTQADKHRYAIEDVSYEAVLRVRQELRSPSTAVLTRIEQTEQGIALSYSVRVATGRGVLPNLRLRVKDGAADAFHVNAPGATVQRIKDAAKTWDWLVRYPTGMPQEVFITLRTRADVSKQPQLLLPTVEVENSPFQANWIAWKDLDLLNTATAKKLTHDPLIKEQVVKQGSDGHAVDAPGWSYASGPRVLQAVSTARTAPRSSLRLLSHTEDIQQDPRGYWVHSTASWLHAPDSVELRIGFPSEIEQASVLLDGRLLPVRVLSPTELALPLEGHLQPRLLQIAWKGVKSDGVKPPSLTGLQVEQAPQPATQRRLWTPIGIEPAFRDNRQHVTLLRRLLEAAEARVQIAATLGQEGLAKSKMMENQQRAFFTAIQDAEYLVTVLPHAQSDFDATPWRDRISQLKSKNAALARERGYDRQRENAQKMNERLQGLPFDAPSPATGLPWLLTADAPVLSLDSMRDRDHADGRSRSEWLLLATVLLIVLSYFRRGFALLRHAIPESVALTVGVLILLEGVSMIGLAIIALMALLRIYKIADYWWQRAAEAKPKDPTDGSTKLNPASMPPSA